jgi:hypothetical protein
MHITPKNVEGKIEPNNGNRIESTQKIHQTKQHAA